MPHSSYSVAISLGKMALRTLVAFLIGFLFACCVAFGAKAAYADDVVVGSSSTPAGGAGIQSRAISDSALIYVTGKNNQSEARTLISYVNEARLSRSASLSTLTWDYDLEEAAKQRAAEIAIYYDPDYRPDGTSFGTLVSSGHTLWDESILAGTSSLPASSAIAAWKDGGSNYQIMTSPNYTCMGAASFTISGATYWVVMYGTTNHKPVETAAVNSDATYKVFALPDNLKMSFAATLPSTVTKGYSMQYALVNTNIPLANRGGTWKDHRTAVDNTNFTWTSSSVGVASIDKLTGKVIAQAKGTTTIKATNQSLASFSVSAPSTIAIGTKPTALNPGTGNASSANNSSNNTNSSSGVTVTGKWMKSGSRWWYSYSNGTYAVGLKKIGSSTYYFDSKGWMKTGWQHATRNSDWYYFSSSGAMKTGWLKSGGKWYYLNSSGKMLTGERTISGIKYFLNASGAMHTGWKKVGSKWYYFAPSGAMAKGWAKVGRKWYYLAPSTGIMQTGLYTVGNAKYYSNSSGAMVTGWQKISKKWHYFSGSGAMKTGWVKTGGKWYYLDPAQGGKMLTGKVVLDRRIYYLRSSGSMVTGWNHERYGWCYYNKSGHLVMNSWISGKYWVGETGYMATNSWVDGNRFWVGANGAYVKGKK